MSAERLAELRHLVIDDAGLRDRLLSAPDRDTFVAEVVAIARERGIEVTSDDVRAGLQAERRRHYEQWV